MTGREDWPSPPPCPSLVWGVGVGLRGGLSDAPEPKLSLRSSLNPAHPNTGPGNQVTVKGGAGPGFEPGAEGLRLGEEVERAGRKECLYCLGRSLPSAQPP